MIFNTMELTYGLIGGLIIGLSVTIMLLFQGRVTGISGITYGLMTLRKNDWVWRGFFIAGLIAGGFVLKIFYPEAFVSSLNYSQTRVAIAGLLVGFGTLLGNGCTSGHGVCGISRFSLRSITATLTFIVSGIVTVYFVNQVL